MFAAIALAALGHGSYIDPAPPHRWYRVYTPGWPGVVLDKHGPPKTANFWITYVFHTVPGVPPQVEKVSYGGYTATALAGDLFAWNKQGFVVQEVGKGKGQIRFVGLRQDGWLLPVTRIEMFSKDLPPHLLPKVVTSSKPDA